MTSEASASAIAILRDAYPRQDFPDRTVLLYARDLSDVDADDLVPAVRRLIHRSKFLPTIAEIREEVAEGRLGLPDTASAWDIALRGELKSAPAAVRESVDAVGGRWTILHDENPVAIRAHFRRDYEERRRRALLEEMGALAPQYELEPAGERYPLAIAERIFPRPVMARAARILAGMPLEPPSDEEKSDAIAILREGAIDQDVEHDSLYRAAELVLVHASNDDEGGTT